MEHFFKVAGSSRRVGGIGQLGCNFTLQIPLVFIESFLVASTKKQELGGAQKLDEILLHLLGDSWESSPAALAGSAPISASKSHFPQRLSPFQGKSTCMLRCQISPVNEMISDV